MSLSLFRVSALLALSTFLFACPGPAPVPPGDGGLPPPADAGSDGGADAGRDAGVEDPPSDAGTGLFSLGGGLVLDTGVRTPAELRVAVLWFPAIDTAQPSRPAGAETGTQVLRNPFPARWQLELFAEPPAKARGAFTTPRGGSGTRSVGQLVLFRDVDGDGQLTLDDQGGSLDEVWGSSAGVMPFDADGPGYRLLVVWREGTLGTDEAGYRAGFNLVAIDEPFATPVVVPSATDVTLIATGDPRHALTFCEAAYAPEPPEFACGQRIFRTPRVTAVLTSSDGVLLASVQASAGARALTNATVRLNGTVMPFDGDSGYLLVELEPTVIHLGMNSLRVEAPGFEPVKLEVVLPRAPTFILPVEHADLMVEDEFTVSWFDSEGATTFDVSITAQNGQSAFTTTHQREATLSAPNAPGPATVRVVATAERAQGRHTALGMSDGARDVTLIAP
jgi:hypothetical protein